MAAWSYRGVKQPIRVEAIWPMGSGDESWHENSNLAPSNSSVGVPTKVGSHCNQNSASLLVAIRSCWIWQAQDCLNCCEIGRAWTCNNHLESTSKNNTKSCPRCNPWSHITMAEASMVHKWETKLAAIFWWVLFAGSRYHEGGKYTFQKMCQKKTLQKHQGWNWRWLCLISWFATGFKSTDFWSKFAIWPAQPYAAEICSRVRSTSEISGLFFAWRTGFEIWRSRHLWLAIRDNASAFSDLRI